MNQGNQYSPFAGYEPTRYGLTVVTPPASEPITLTEAKTHCRVDISTDDTYITSLIQVAREHIEDLIGRRIVAQTWDLTLDQFPWPFYMIRLPYGPISSITSVSYVDVNGTTQTWASSNYSLDSASFEPRLYVSYANIYPVTRWIPNAITIRYVAGYTTVPEKLKHAVRMLVKHLYDDERGIVNGLKLENTPRGFDALIASERQSWL